MKISFPEGRHLEKWQGSENPGWNCFKRLFSVGGKMRSVAGFNIRPSKVPKEMSTIIFKDATRSKMNWVFA